MIYDATTTVEHVLENWDAGEAVWLVELGGIGPGYEQAIQVLVIELLRKFTHGPLPLNAEAFKEWGNDVVTHLSGLGFGFSFAQVNVAKSMALQFLRAGYGSTMVSVESERKIQARKHFPVAP